jgi:PKD repeat protein
MLRNVKPFNKRCVLGRAVPESEEGSPIKIIVMRKFYLLLTIFLGLFTQANSQDTANFNFIIGSNFNVAFVNTSHLHGDGIRKAYWSFGDGTRQMTPPLANTSHHYNNAATYTTCLRIYKYFTNTNDSILTGEVCKTFTLSNTNEPDSCRAYFVSEPSVTLTSLSQTFIAQPWHNHDKKPEQICWNFGDNHDTCISYNPSLSNNYAVHHTYAQPGQYNVCVTIRYQGGCQSTFCRIIILGDACRADYHVEPVAASPTSFHFIANTWHVQQKKPLRICWNFGDGSPSVCNDYAVTYTGPYATNHTFAQPGQYTVCVKILYDGGCESQKCKVFTVPPQPPHDSCFVNIFEVAGNINSLERHFYAGLMPNRTPEEICWYFGDGTDTCINLPSPVASQSLTITHHYPAPGVYHVCVKVRYAGGCIAIKCHEVLIRSQTNLCGGYMSDSVTGARTFLFKGFGVMNANDHVISWRWTFGDGISGNGQQVSHTYSNSGNYEVCLYIKTDLGCETRICKHVVIVGINQPQLTLSPNPVTTILHAVFLSTLQEQVTINIYNANGVVVRTYTRSAIAGVNTWDLDVATLPAGVYSVIVSSPHQLANAIFFKQ